MRDDFNQEIEFRTEEKFDTNSLLQQREREIKELQNKIQDLEKRLDAKKLKRRHEKMWYFVPFFAVVVFTGYLVHRGWAEKPAVTIEFNVGEIVGGLLVGIGVLMAGFAYAFGRVGRE